MEMTKSKRVEECRRIINSLMPNEGVTDLDDFNFLVETFKMNESYDDKTRGHEIIRIDKRLSGHGRDNYCFYITMDDGCYTDISFTKLGIYPDERKVKDALRFAVRPVILEFRKTFKPFTCINERGEEEYIDSIDKCDIDHYDLKFNDLANIWIERNGGIENLIKYVNKRENNCTITYLTDKSLVDDFVEFHNNNTHLRFMKKPLNRKSH